MNELFEFILEEERIFYTSGEEDVEFEGKIYKSVLIYRDEINKDTFNDDANIKIGLNVYPANLFKFFNPSMNVIVKILNEKGVLLFAGRIKDIEFNLKDGIATVKLATLGGVMKSKIPSRVYSKECGFECFGKGCGLNKKDFCVVLNGDECEFSNDFMSIKSEKLKSCKEGYFNGGYVEFEKQRSFITEFKDDTIKLLFPLGNLKKSSVIYCYAGCDKLLNTCKNKFNNAKNYGGFPFVPAKNPVTQGY